jgi:DNA-binding protein H-NS
METNDFQSMSVDELWNLYQEVAARLARSITAERARLGERLRRIEEASNVTQFDRVRRPYPVVLPKYQNPKNPAETWSGRGKQPRWLTAQLRAGRRLEDFLIDRSSVQKRRRSA